MEYNNYINYKDLVVVIMKVKICQFVGVNSFASSVIPMRYSLDWSLTFEGSVSIALIQNSSNPKIDDTLWQHFQFMNPFDIG